MHCNVHTVHVDVELCLLVEFEVNEKNFLYFIYDISIEKKLYDIHGYTILYYILFPLITMFLLCNVIF